jgi:hypothetical protein
MKNSDELKKELDIRLQNLEEGKTELYTWDEVKNHLKSIRQMNKYISNFSLPTSNF